MKKITGYVLIVTGIVLWAACRKTPTQEAINQMSVVPAIDTFGIAGLQPRGFVNDFEGIFTEAEVKTLDSLMLAYEKQTTVQMAIVTLDTAHVGPELSDMFEATLAIANNWGVGQKEKDNGILIGISAGRAQMYVQNGKGIEKILTDEATQKIVEEVFIPQYALGNYYMGTYSGAKAIMELLEKSSHLKN